MRETTTETAAADDYLAAVNEQVAALVAGCDQFKWVTVPDPRTRDPRSVEPVRGTWFGLRQPAPRQATLRVPGLVATCLTALTAAQRRVERLSLPVDDTVPDQIASAMDRIYPLADEVCALNSDPAQLHPATAEILWMSARVLVLAALAEEREAVLRAVDAASLERTGADMVATIAAAREVLAGDDLDRRLVAAQAPDCNQGLLRHPGTVPANLWGRRRRSRQT